MGDGLNDSIAESPSLFKTNSTDIDKELRDKMGADVEDLAASELINDT